MIEVKSACSSEDFYPKNDFTVGFYGDSIDKRSRHSAAYVKDNSVASYSITYSLDELCLNFDDEIVQCENLDEIIENYDLTSVVVDATSLSIPSLALLTKALSKLKGTVLYLYVEPYGYSSDEGLASASEEFKLSESITGFETAGIPTISRPVDFDVSRKFIFFLGFEEGRLMNAIEVYDIPANEAKMIFGVPAFKPSWEFKSIKRNLQALKSFDMRNSIEFCGANNVVGSLNMLRKFSNIYKNSMIHLIPVGTKPHALAAILFMAENIENTNLLFDQPKKKKERSKGVGERHFYKVSFNL